MLLYSYFLHFKPQNRVTQHRNRRLYIHAYYGGVFVVFAAADVVVVVVALFASVFNYLTIIFLLRLRICRRAHSCGGAALFGIAVAIDDIFAIKILLSCRRC